MGKMRTTQVANEVIKVRLTPEERARVVRAMDLEGVTNLSEYVRLALVAYIKGLA